MTQPYVHCPFCLEEFDIISDCENITIGSMELLKFDCSKHGTITIISDNIYDKASPGRILAECPKCNKTIFLDQLKNLRGNG